MTFVAKRLGKIFDPTTTNLFGGCESYAQSPQAVVFDDYIRIYFSTRSVDQINGKFLSHIAFVDMSRDLSEILAVSDKAVVELGELGSFDEHGIFPISPFRDDDGRIFAFTTGWSRRVSVSVETGIGLVQSSDDGRTFQRLGEGPVLSASVHEPVLVGDGFVRKYDGVYHMWYIFGTHWKMPEGDEPAARVYKIGQATSYNLMDWTKKDGRRIIADGLNADECQALPTVIMQDNRWHMFFCYREATDFRRNTERGYRIGYAWSDDLDVWTREDAKLGLSASNEGWDSEMLCYPNVFQCGERVFLLYNGNEFGRYGFGAAELYLTR